MVMREIFGVRRRGSIPSSVQLWMLTPGLAKPSETAVTLTTIGPFGGGEHLVRTDMRKRRRLCLFGCPASFCAASLTQCEPFTRADR
jgi:hypothetical protein